MRRLLNILLPVILLLAASCERRPMVELSNTHYVRVYVSEDIKNVTTGFYNEEDEGSYGIYVSQEPIGNIILNNPIYKIC